jgi:predicted phage terminase large subunit-like protein
MPSIAQRLLKVEKHLETYKEASNDLPDAEFLKGSLWEFCKYFYKILTGDEFLNRPGQNRRSFIDILIPVLEGVVNHDPMYHRVAIRCPPRYGKTELLLLTIAWAYAKYPTSKSLYTSYNFQLASKQTKHLKRIMTLPEYKTLFGLEILNDSRSSFDFQFNTGGEVYGAGAGGTIVGTGAGKFGDEFGGLIVMDDPEKPNEIFSEKYRSSSKEWFQNTLATRTNDVKTPIVAIGHELHEDDLIKSLINGEIDSNKWTSVIIPALDSADNALMPSKHTSQMLLDMKETSRYVFWSQFQQNAVGEGNGLFLTEDFKVYDDIPDNIEFTFLTVDTAETDKTYNDATVFSFWGFYNIKHEGRETGTYGIHWLDCQQVWIEPKDLQAELMSFYNSCMRFHVKPKAIAIEKKSTGVTLISNLKEIPGIRIVEIQRTKAGGSKSTRFIEMQQYIASKRISLHKFGKHTSMCIEHMSKITANDSHRYDDIADTVYDAVKIALIDGTIGGLNINKVKHKVIPGYQAVPKSSFQKWKK